MFGAEKKLLAAMLMEERQRTAGLTQAVASLLHQVVAMQQQQANEYGTLVNEALTQNRMAIQQMREQAAVALAEVIRASKAATSAIMANNGPDETRHIASIIGMQERAADWVAATPHRPSVEEAMESAEIEAPAGSPEEVLVGDVLGGPPGTSVIPAPIDPETEDTA